MTYQKLWKNSNIQDATACYCMEFLKRNKKNTDELCIKAINEHLDLVINDRDIDRTHRIGNPRNAGEKPRPRIIKLVRYNDRKKFFDSKKKLNGKKIAITESLTVTRMKKLNEARKMFGLHTEKLYKRMGREKLKYAVVNTS